MALTWSGVSAGLIVVSARSRGDGRQGALGALVVVRVGLRRGQRLRGDRVLLGDNRDNEDFVWLLQIQMMKFIT